MRHHSIRSITVITAVIISFGVITPSEAAWDAPTITIRSGYEIASPHLLELQDGRTMLTFTQERYGSTHYIYYMISTNGAWSIPILIGTSYHGYDPTVAQNPATGEIVVAYAKYDTLTSSPWWHASLYVTRITPENLDRYVTTFEACGMTYEIEPTNYYWSGSQLVVNSGYESLDGYYGYADDIVPNIFFVQNSSSVKLMIIYAHGWEPQKYYPQVQSAQLRAVESWDGGNSWSYPRSVYDTPYYYDSKPSCTGFGYDSPGILCSFYRRDRSTGYSGIFTIRSADQGYTWYGPYTVFSESVFEHKWPFVLKNGAKMFLAYTTKNGSQGGDFIVKWLVSVDGGYTWAWDRKISDQLSDSETWPALAGRYDYVGPLHGLAAVWDNDTWSNPAEHKVFSSNLHEFLLLSPRGGESWFIGTSRTIVWNDSFMPTSNNVALSISRDSGLTWEHIESSTPNTGSYPWTVTAPASLQSYISVKSDEYTSTNYPAFAINYYYG